MSCSGISGKIAIIKHLPALFLKYRNYRPRTLFSINILVLPKQFRRCAPSWSDAHGKNLSFFMNSAGLVPAPLYDLNSDVYVDEERALVQHVSDFVCAQADHLLRLAPMVLEVDLQLL